MPSNHRRWCSVIINSKPHTTVWEETTLNLWFGRYVESCGKSLLIGLLFDVLKSAIQLLNLKDMWEVCLEVKWSEASDGLEQQVEPPEFYLSLLLLLLFVVQVALVCSCKAETRTDIIKRLSKQSQFWKSKAVLGRFASWTNCELAPAPVSALAPRYGWWQEGNTRPVKVLPSPASYSGLWLTPFIYLFFSSF